MTFFEETEAVRKFHEEQASKWVMENADAIRALDSQIKTLAEKIWERHPNNPKNKGKGR